mmetsp:Transcript_1507/g.5554  ORF Transcript_1507/g.5554 Transcript_1507/m.5554 type:complete len:220 (+) Transcript_1507:818-1477(+)
MRGVHRRRLGRTAGRRAAAHRGRPGGVGHRGGGGANHARGGAGRLRRGGSQGGGCRARAPSTEPSQGDGGCPQAVWAASRHGRRSPARHLLQSRLHQTVRGGRQAGGAHGHAGCSAAHRGCGAAVRPALQPCARVRHSRRHRRPRGRGAGAQHVRFRARPQPFARNDQGNHVAHHPSETCREQRARLLPAHRCASPRRAAPPARRAQGGQAARDSANQA